MTRPVATAPAGRRVGFAVSRWVVPVGFLAIMFGGVGVSQAAGAWVTNGRVQQVTAPGEAQVSGSMTLREAAATNGVELAALVARLGLPADVDPDRQLKELKDEGGFDMDAVRAAVTALR